MFFTSENNPTVKIVGQWQTEYKGQKTKVKKKGKINYTWNESRDTQKDIDCDIKYIKCSAGIRIKG